MSISSRQSALRLLCWVFGIESLEYCMPLSALIGLLGFFLGIVLDLFLASIVLRRHSRRRLEASFLFLLGGLLVWNGGNFVSLLLRHMDLSRVAPALQVVDLLTFAALGLLPPLLLHTHWLYFRHFHPLRGGEHRIILPLLVLLYTLLLFLPLVLPYLLSDPETHPLQKLGPFKAPFLVMLSLSYFGCCYLHVVILKRSRNPVERRFFRLILVCFLLTPVFNFYVFLWGGQQAWGEGIVIAALLASVVPTLLVAYFIYRHQFLQIPVQRTIASALLMLVVLAVYVFGLRRFGQYLQDELAGPPLLVEVALLLAIVLFFPPLAGWMERLVSGLSGGEIRKYREIAETLRRGADQLVDPFLFKEFTENLLARELEAVQVDISFETPGRAESRAEEVFPLVSGGQEIGRLTLKRERGDLSAAEREALRLLSGEIATAWERCRLLQNKLRMERELAHRSHMEDLGRVAANVAHNVKNPLSSLKTILQLQGEAENLKPEQKQEIAMMIREIDRLAQTVTNLLKFSRPETETDEGKTPELIDLQQMVASFRSLFRGDLESRRLRFDIRSDPNLPPVHTRPDLLIDVISNILSNAIEASPNGAGIVVEILMHHSWVEIGVTDEGPGIPEHLRSRVFEPFVSTKSRGTGLGLAIAARRVQQLKGRIDFKSPLDGTGTRFTIHLPVEGVRE